jgi:hypothetical protein
MTEPTLFDDIPKFPTFLKEVRDQAISRITDPEQLKVATEAVDAAMGTILTALNAPIPSCDWVLMEYRGTYCPVKHDVVEITRPATFTVQDYWDQVNG